MKTIIKLLLTILISGSAYAQEFKGVATYKTLTKLDLKLDEENGGGIKHLQAVLKSLLRFKNSLWSN